MIAITRFNDTTYRENREWCQKNGYQGTIYGTPMRISEKISPDVELYVLEMNNSTNRIMGIGYIIPGRNTIKRAKIYGDNNYNRFIYNSSRRIDLEEDYVSIKLIKIIIILEKVLFYGSRHCKRGQGIQLLPQWIRLTPINRIGELIKKYFDKKVNK